MYHRINQPDPTSSLIVSPEAFLRQIDWLEKKAFRFLSLDEVVDRGARASFGERSIALSFDDGFRDNYENAFLVLTRRRKKAALFIVVHWVGREDFLSWREIRELADSGITIGSHSLSHRWLPDISDARELRSEVFDSKKKIEDEIGREAQHFCYPVGGVNERVAEEVKRAGYRAAWVAGGRPSIQIDNHLLSLRRIKVGPSDSSLLRFAIKAWGIKGIFRG